MSRTLTVCIPSLRPPTRFLERMSPTRRRRVSEFDLLGSLAAALEYLGLAALVGVPVVEHPRP